MFVATLLFAFQIVCCVATHKMWVACGKHLETYYPKYKHLTDSKKMYVSKNIVKAGSLALVAIPGLVLIIRVAVFDQWNSPLLIKLLGTLYASNDLTGLVLMAKKLPRSTLIHHLVVLLFSFCNIFVIDFNNNCIWRHLAILASCSAQTFAVNFYLGARHVLEDQRKKNLIPYIYYNYFIFIALSALWQFGALFRSPLNVYTVFYSALVFMIFWDDSVLLNFLQEEMSRFGVKYARFKVTRQAGVSFRFDSGKKLYVENEITGGEPNTKYT